MEFSVRSTSLEKKASQRFTSPVNISVHSKRFRLADPDGICVKYVIDEIVNCGLLEDDSAEWVKEVRYTQEKIDDKSKEKTIVTIEAINNH